MAVRILCVALVMVSLSPALAIGQCCLVPDNGGGTADLPPGCAQGYVGSLELIEGVPAGATIEMAAQLKDFVLVSQVPGGSLNGTIEDFTATAQLDVVGTGTLAGFQRTLFVPVTGITHSGPRIAGAPVQNFPIRVVRLQGILSGDYDFSLLWFEGGDIFGLPSPGTTRLERQGPAGSDFSAVSAFDFQYRIQFEGSPESFFISGERGITLDLESEFALCALATSAPAGITGLQLTAAPNPVRGATTLRFALGAQGEVDLDVFDARGRRVRRLSRGLHQEGPQRLLWDGRDERGERLPAGVYFARLRVRAAGDDVTEVARLSLLR